MTKVAKAKYYEETDFSEVMKKSAGRKLIPSAKRITMNITNKIYEEANELDTYLGMGYQNVLKTAITIGLTELYQKVSSHKVVKKSAS